MPSLSMREFGKIAAQLGHANLEVLSTPGGSSYYALCGCGYRSTNKRTAALAASSAVRHFEIVARDFAASGASVPRPADIAEAV